MTLEFDQGLMLPVSSIVFLLFSMVFLLAARSHRNRAMEAKTEYESTRGLVKGLVTNFSLNQKKQSERITVIEDSIKEVSAKMDLLELRTSNEDSEFLKLLQGVATSLIADTKIAHSVIDLQKTIKSIQVQLDRIDQHVSVLEKQYREMLPEDEAPMKHQDELSEKTSVLGNLTSTELTILRMLISEGSKSSPEIEKRIGKTREHTSRLMRKLYSEGYVERNTHSIPYAYEANEKLKGIIPVAGDEH